MGIVAHPPLPSAALLPYNELNKKALATSCLWEGTVTGV